MSEEDNQRSGPNVTAVLQLLVLLVMLSALFALYQGRRDTAPRQYADQEDVGSMVRAFDGDNIQISPDGEWLAFLRGQRFRRDIWIAPRDSASDAHALGLAEEQGVLSFQWALEGTRILFRRPFNVATQIYVVDVEAAQIAPLNALADTVVGEVTLSPSHPNEMLVRMGPSPGNELDLYRANVLTGELQLVETRGAVDEYYADQNFTVLAGRTFDPRGITIHARRDTGWEEVLFVKRDLGDRAGVLFLSEGGNQMYVLDDENRETIALSSIDLGTGERRIIAAAENGDVAEVLRDPVSFDIFAYAVETDGLVWHALDQAYATDITQLNDINGAAPRVVSQSLDNQIWIIESGPAFYLFDRNQDTVTQITS